MAADPDPGAPEPPAAPERRAIRSVSLLCGCAVTVILEVLVLFGARPLAVWHVSAGAALVLGGAGGWIDAQRENPATQANRVAIVSLVVGVVALVVALVAFLAQVGSLG